MFHQALLLDRPDVKITFARDLVFEPPIVIDGAVALETGSPVVWFTFPGVWHDIGRFHTADGTFTGYYANILTPPSFEEGGIWRTTDLFLDVWLPPGGRPTVLDRDQFDEAVREGWVDEATRRRALAEVEAILEGHGAGLWPPGVVRRWTLERVVRARG